MHDDLLIATTVAQITPRNVTAPTKYGRCRKAFDVLLAHGADLNPSTTGIAFQGHRIFRYCRCARSSASTVKVGKVQPKRWKYGHEMMANLHRDPIERRL